MKNLKNSNTVEEIKTMPNEAIVSDDVKSDKGREEKFRTEGFSTAPTSLLQAIERIDKVAKGCGFKRGTLRCISREIDYLHKRMGLNSWQAVMFSVVVNRGEEVTVKKLSDHLKISTAYALSLLTVFKKLERLELIKIEDTRRGIVLSVPSDVLFRLSQDKDFKRESPTGLDSNGFLSHCYKHICKAFDKEIDREELGEEIQNLIDNNKTCNLVKELKKLKVSKPYQLVLLSLCVASYKEQTDMIKTDLLWICALSSAQFNTWKREFSAGTHYLVKKGYLEYDKDDGIVDTRRVGLSKDMRARLLGDVEVVVIEEPLDGVTPSLMIKPKELFYDGEVAKQVDNLAKFLDQDNYNNIVERMERSNFRSAFTCLFYGSPGTGKTETVNQLARLTGRDIMVVDVPNLKSKWVGESEKNVKAVFDEYRDLVQYSEVTPILLFNEADSIFGKRIKDVTRSVDQMNNTIQNIILQEMETLDGILIATTNLTENLDEAFDRRFLYKIKFERPGVEARGHIWHTMIPELSDDEVHLLASSYEFSGGQIENVARKFSINTILYGDDVDKRMETLVDFCDNEQIEDTSIHRNRVGF